MIQLDYESHDQLTAQEILEIQRITSDPDVIAYALLDLDGRELNTSGAWSDMLAPIFANVVDLTGRVGEELGEENASSMMFIEGPAFDAISVRLTSTCAVFLKRKTKNVREVLRSVG